MLQRPVRHTFLGKRPSIFEFLTSLYRTVDEVAKCNQETPADVLKEMKSILHLTNLKQIQQWQQSMANSIYTEVQSKYSLITIFNLHLITDWYLDRSYMIHKSGMIAPSKSEVTILASLELGTVGVHVTYTATIPFIRWQCCSSHWILYFSTCQISW